MKEMLLKDVKVGQGFYEKGTGMYYNRISLAQQDDFRELGNWVGFIPVIGPKWELGFIEENTIVII